MARLRCFYCYFNTLILEPVGLLPCIFENNIPCFWWWSHAVPNFLHFRAEVLTRGQCTPCQVPGFFLKVRGRMILDAPRVFTPNPVMSHTFDKHTKNDGKSPFLMGKSTKSTVSMAGRWRFACWDCAGYVKDPLHHGCGRLPDAAQGGCLNVAHEFWKSIWMWVKMEDLGDHRCECLVEY